MLYCLYCPFHEVKIHSTKSLTSSDLALKSYILLRTTSDASQRYLFFCRKLYEIDDFIGV